MNDEDSNYTVAGRYRTVRKNLDAIGYKQAFSIDSLPLIELLLVDLAQTRESLKHFQSIAKDNLEACDELQLAVEPYKCDNARLAQECNQLHSELVEAKETIEKQSNDYKRRIRKLETELSGLRLSFSKNTQRLKSLEKNSSEKSSKISESLGKCSKPINSVSSANKKRSCYPIRSPGLRAEPLPTTTTFSSTSFDTRKVDPFIFDSISKADQRISDLTDEIDKLKEELSLSNEQIEFLNSQLDLKNKEMSRLRKMFEGGRPCMSLHKDHCCSRHEKTNGCENLPSLKQAQLQLEKLEQELKEALNKQHDAMTQAMKLAERNEELENELKNVDRMALRVEADCNSTVKENNRRVCRLQEKLENVMTQVHVLESELTVQRREAQELRADLEACRLEKSNVQRTLETTLEEKKQMTDRINNLTLMESKLTDELRLFRVENESQKKKIDELEQNHKNQNQNTAKKNITKSPVHKADNKSACNSRNPREKEEKAKSNAKEKLTRSSVSASKNPIRNSGYQDQRNAANSNKSAREKAFNDKPVDEFTQCNTERLLKEKNVIIESLQNTIERLESERDHYKAEYVALKDQSKTDNGKEDLWSQICELRAQVSEKENAISKLLREKKELFQEKYDLENKLHANQSHQRTNSSCECRHSSTLKSPEMSNRIERLIQERDASRADVERLMEERDALRERLKLATEAHVVEQCRLRESLAESESRLAHTSSERRQLLIVQGGRRAALDGLDQQLADIKEELHRTKAELTEQRTQYFQLRALQDQTDQALSDVQGQLSHTESELSAALDRNKNLERQQQQLDNQVKELRQEIANHRSKVAQIDREKDQLLMDLDEKTEKIAALEKEIVFKEQQLTGLEQQVRDLSHTKQICMEQVADAERQTRSLQLELDNQQRQVHALQLERDSSMHEGRRLADEVAELGCELRNVHKQLEAARAESQDLRRQLQGYVAEVNRAEELLSQKENERTEMLNQFRSLSLEASVLENNNHSLESEAAEARGALQSARDQIAELERRLIDKDCGAHGLENQIHELRQTCATLELQLEQTLEQRLQAEDELRTVRDLCVTLEQQKDLLSQRLEDCIDKRTQYEVQVARYKSEQDIFQDQMNKDHMAIDRLERLLEEARKETIDAQTNCRELQNEVSRLKQKLCDVQNKLSSETREVRKYQTQAAEYSKQISELRRQVTNERFERSKKKEESAQSNRVVACLKNQRHSSCKCRADCPHCDKCKPTKACSPRPVSASNQQSLRSLNSSPDSFGRDNNTDRCANCGGTKAPKTNEDQDCVAPCWLPDVTRMLEGLLLDRRRESLSLRQTDVNQTLDSGRSSLSSSTQTEAKDASSIPENAKPHLVDLLADIEQYARSIQQHFRALSDSIRQDVSTSAIASASSRSPECRNALENPQESKSKMDSGVLDESVPTESVAPAASSTPRSRREALVSLEDERLSFSVEAQATRNSTPSPGIDDDDDDETVYKRLPDCLERPPEVNLSDSEGEIAPAEDGLLEQMNQAVQEVGTIQEKIEQLRRDLLADRANSPFRLQKRADKCDK